MQGIIVHSMKPKPIRSQWYTEGHVVGELKEVLGSITLFHWHCSTPMRRVITYQKSDEGVRRIGCNSWICQVCEIRQYNRPLGM